jgi:MORN repeat protein
MRVHASRLVCCGIAIAVAVPAFAHDCRVLGNGYLRGSYEGECYEKDELAHGQGEAKGADTYVGTFVKGRPDGKGVYTWEKGGRLEGTFKAGKANGPGVYVAANGARYEGPFENGKLSASKPEDCPATSGPLNC